MTKLKEALKEMFKDGEFEKLIKNSKGKEKMAIKGIFEAIKDFNDEDYEKVPEIVFIQAIKSYQLWADIYCYILMIEEREEASEKQDTKKE